MSLSDDESASTQYDESATSSDHAEKIVAANFMDIRKNLNLHEFATPKPVDNVDQSEHMRVYLRIRPFLKEELEKKENQDCIIQETETSLFVHAPKDSITFKNTAHGCAKLNHKFSFSNIFNENTSQKVFFNQTTLSTVKDFVDGQNCLVFSHGVTSSGKTHTILGNPHDAGILPRSLDVVFNSIEGKQWTSMTLKPKLFCDVARLNANQIEVEKLVKQKVFAMASDDDKKCSDLLGDDVVSSTDSSISSIVNEDSTAKDSTSRESDIVNELQSDIETFEDLQNRERDDAIVDIGTQGDILFSVWVSFCEIYNEFIYDLLESVPKKKKAKRPSLKLSEDRNGNPYVKGLTWINVISADEAFQILNIGQRNLRIASTKLNHNSSRSHSIFSLKILRVVKKENPNMARISMLSFCDLAGSERSRKTQSKGERMKEAAHINTSLLTLGRCIENLRYNQHHKSNQKVIPFRESKLTRLFQSFFCGQGRASMIVNINQNASMFDETLHVLKFSAIAKQVYNVQKPEVPKVEPRYRALSLGLMSSVGKNTRARATSIAWCSPATQQKLLEEERLQKLQEEMKEKDVSVSEDLDVTLADTSFADRERELLDAIEFLQKQLVKERTEKVLVEARVREEVCAEMSEMFIKIEQECSERIEEERAAAEELAERKIEMYKKFVQPNRKRARLDNGNENEDVVEECVSVNQLKEVEDKLKERDFLVKQLEETVENLNMELESTKQRLINVTEDCDESRVVVSSLKFELADLKTKITEDNLSSSENKNTSGTPAARLNDTLAEICNNEIVERLSRQLEEAQSKLKDQEKETSELQAMLTEAGDAFLEKEIEIEKLKAAIIEDERRIEVQEQTVEEMKRVIAEGQKAMEIAEQKLLRRDEKLSKLEAGWEQLTSKLNEAQSVMEILKESEKAFHHLKEEYDSMQKAFEKSRLENSSLNEMCATLKERVEEKTKEDAMNQSTLHDLANEQHGIILELEKEKTLKEVANTKLSEQEKKLSEYENIIKQQEKTLKDVLSLKEKLEDEIEFEKACSKELRYQVNALEGKISDYQKDSHKDLDKIEELSARCHELTEELKLEQLSVLDLNSTMSQFSVMKQEVNDLKLKLQDVKQQLEDREKEFEIITIELKNEIAAKKKAENLLKNTLNMEKLVQNSQTVLSNNDRLNKELDEEHQLRITLEETITKLNIKIEGLQATLVKVVAESESLNTKAKEQCIVLQEHKETSQRIEKELKEEIAELKASAELTSYTNEETISDLQQKIEDNESKLEDVRNEKYSSDDEIKCLNTKITDLEQSLELIEAAKEQFSIKAQKLESQADIDKDCIECYCEKIKSMEETIANLSNQLSQESGEPKAYVVKVHELQVRLDESNQNVEFQTQIAKTLNDKNCLLAEDNQSLQKDIVELKKSCDNLEASLQEANKSYREREIKLSELKASHSSLSKRVTDLEKKSINDEMLIDDLQVDKDAIQIKLNEMLEKNTNLMSSYGAKEKEFLQHRSKVEETQAEYNEIIKNLKSELLEWKEKHHRSVNENQETTCSLNTDNQRLQSENVLLNKSNKELNGKISLLEAELEEIENFENETSVDVGELKEQCEQLKSKLAEMETTASRRNAKIVEKNQTIEDLTIKAETHLSLYENCLKEITGLKECLKEQEMVAEQQDEVIKTGDERISQLQKENQALQASEDLKIKEVEIKNLTELLKEREYSISSKDASLRSKGLDMEQWRDKCDELSKCLADKNREIDRLESLSETHLNSELALEREKWQKKISAKDQIIQELKDVNNKLQEKFKADKSDDGNMNETSHLLGVPSETNVVDLSTSVLSNISNTSHVSANSFVCQVDFDEPEYDSSAIKKRPNKQSTGRKQRSNEKEDHVTFSVQKSKTDTEPATKKKPGRRRLYTANPPILDATPAKQKAAADEAQARSTRTLRSSKKKTST